MPRPDTPAPDPSGSPAAPIAVGDRVRSFDFAHVGLTAVDGDQACYAEGVVEAVGRFPEIASNCDHYKVRVDRYVMAGEPVADFPPYVFPPVNGVPIWGSERRTDGVVRITRSDVSGR